MSCSGRVVFDACWWARAIVAAVASVILVIYSFATRSVMEPKTGSLVIGIVGFIAAGLIFVLSGGVVTFQAA